MGATVEDVIAIRTNRQGQGSLDPSLPTPVEELIDGALYAYERAARLEHLWHPLTDALFNDLERVKGSDWGCAHGAQLLLRGNVLAPVAAAWRGKQPPAQPLLPEYDRHSVYAQTPQLVLEIVCSKTAAHVRERKLPVYAEAGVEMVWLMHVDERRFEVLELRGGAWSVREAHTDEVVIHAYPFPCAKLDLATFWDTHSERSQRVCDLVDKLGEARAALEAGGASHANLFLYLLKRLGLGFDQSCGQALVGEHMMRSRWVVLRARALVTCMVPLERALRIAEHELAADRTVAAMTDADGEEMATRYCDLLRRYGEDHHEVRELVGTARAWARRALSEWSEPRVDRLGYRHAPPAVVRALHDADADASGPVPALRDLVMNGSGTWLVPRDAWHRAVAQTVAGLSAPRLETGALETLFATLKRHDPTPFKEPYVRRSDDSTSAWLQEILSKGRAAEEDADTRCERSREDDITLEWLALKQEMQEDLAVLRRTGSLPERLDHRGATGEGYALLSRSEYALVQAAQYRSLAAQLDDLEERDADHPDDRTVR